MKRLQLQFLNPSEAAKHQFHQDFWPENRLELLDHTKNMLWSLTQNTDKFFPGIGSDDLLIVDINVINSFDETKPNTEYRGNSLGSIRFLNELNLNGTTSISSSTKPLSFLHIHEQTHNYLDFDSTVPSKIEDQELLRLYNHCIELTADHTPTIVAGADIVCDFLKNHAYPTTALKKWNKETHPSIETRILSSQNSVMAGHFTKAVEAAQKCQNEGKPFDSWKHFLENKEEIESTLKGLPPRG